MSQDTRFAPLPEAAGTEPARAEDLVLERWRAERTFEHLQGSRAAQQPFVFWEGPPTANGRPGIHHVIARTLKDSVCRFRAMLGQRVERKAGWDTHGLPVELEVEKALGISGKPEIERYGVAAFNQKCRESVWKYREEWEKLSERIGFWLDYAHPYVTYEPSYIDSVWYLLARMHREGLVYRSKKVLPWCGRCGTGLSSHELGQPGVYKDVVDPSVIVRFRRQLGGTLFDSLHQLEGVTQESFLAWTTTPWTLPSNFALAVHPDRQYVRARVVNERASGAKVGEVVWVVRDRLSAVLGEPGRDYVELDAHTGSELANLSYEPLFQLDAGVIDDPGEWVPEPSMFHRVVLGEFVTTEDGTGIVHQAPYGEDDWQTARRENFPLPLNVRSDGRFVRDVDGVKAGTFFKDADDTLMEDLKRRGLLFDKRREPHSYPHCWRCSTPLFYFPAPAWFLRTTALKERMLAHNRQVHWVPAELEKRFGEWLENNIDWNISRDRYWGTPLPFWTCENGHERAVESAAELRELADGLPDGFDGHKPAVDAVSFPCELCGQLMARTSAVVDVWFDSGAMPFAQYGWPHVAGSREKLRDQFPADYICEGLDQTRGWFYTLHAIGGFVTGLADAELPDGPTFRTCLVNGLVLDKDGVKMSKRLGNVVDPWKVIAEHGADALRWYLLSSAAPWLAKKFDPAGLAEVRSRFFRAWVNSYKFFAEYARIDRFDPRDPAIPKLAERQEIDRWLASRTQSVCAEVHARLSDYDLTAAARAIDAFVVDELSNWYIRRNRRRFWKGETGADKLAAYATLFEALSASALCAAPLAPFHAEMLWRGLEPDAGSVHAQLFPTARATSVDRDLEESMRVVQQEVVMGRAVREKLGIKTRQPLRALHVRSSDPDALRLLATPFATAQIQDELNVKAWGSLAADDGQLVRLSAKANFKALGKKLGGRMKAAAAAIAALPAPALERLRSGASMTIEVDGAPLELTPEDVLISVESGADFPVETDGRFVAWFDAELDSELVLEGLAREVTSRVNALRKDLGLAVDDRIRIEFHTPDAELARAVGAARSEGGFRELVAAETLAVDVRVARAALAGEGVARIDLDERRTLEARVLRA